MTLLKIDGLFKAYKRDEWVNDNISLAIGPGEVFGLLGPNGAGKTTLVNQVIGLVAPTRGTITLDGVDVVANPAYARQACSFQPQSQVPIEGVTVRQALELVGRIRGGKSAVVRQRAQELINDLEIGDWADQNGQALSGGVRRLVAFCMAAIRPGRLVILDEPTNDVDPLRRRLLWRQVRRLADGGSAVLLVTHNVLEAERSVDRLAIIDRGRLAAMGTPASLKEHDKASMRLELILEPGATPPPLPAFLRQTAVAGRRLIAHLTAGDVNQAVAWAQIMADRGRVEEYSLGPSTLEDVYVRLVDRADVLAVPAGEVQHGLPAGVVS